MSQRKMDPSMETAIKKPRLSDSTPSASSSSTPTNSPQSTSQSLSPIESTSSLSTPSDRKFKKIPIFIVDFHNDVLDFIYRSFATRHLPLKGNTLIHFDSHPDMVIPRSLDPQCVFNKYDLLNELSIESWIMPPCYAGHFDKLVWVKNSFCDQMPTGNYDFNIGDHDGEIRVDLPLDYFVSEGNYSKTDQLSNSKALNLKVINSDDLKDGDLEIQTSESGAVILDIDLDFFSVNNPFLALYSKADMYKKLQAIYSYDESGNRDEVANRRREQLAELEKLFTYLDSKRTLDSYENTSIPPDRYKLIVDLVTSIRGNYNDEEIDWILVNNAGNTSDNNGLPHHKSTDEGLEKYYENFEKFLKEVNLVPTIITMGRSTEDDYCPKDQVESIQTRVVQILQKVYGDKVTDNPIKEYKQDKWDVMKL